MKFFQKVKTGVSKFVKAGAAVAAGVVGMVSGAHAALPTEATAAFTSLGTAVTDVSGAVWPVIGASLVMFTVIKLVKRGANKV